MNKYSIAVDIGASSGRLMLGHRENGQLQLSELYRFENQIVQKGNHFCWELDRLFDEIKTGLKKCRELGIQPDSIGIDTWAVDFVLLDENDQPLTEAVSYRDPRTDGMMEEVFELISKERLYLETGIQFQKFNTIYQLYSLKKNHPDILAKAKSFLMIPDYLNFLLTGKKSNEYTNATSTQLVNAFTKKWDYELLDILGINKDMFHEIQMPKTILGNLKEELVTELGFDMNVILPATHDTGSAVYRFRFLKNIMGLWMIQEVKRNYNHEYSFARLVELAEEAGDFRAIVNVNDDRFLKPDNMIQEIMNYCIETGQSVPSTPGEVAKCVYDSLAASYKETIGEIESIFEKSFDKINVIGGGCQNEMLNQLVADVTNKEVLAGPIEATAIGNIVAQLMALGEITDLEEARSVIKQSFEVKKYEPIKSVANS
ncbi:rhamnulokinase [Robertmurraya sp. FSL R5-0851]|uniref:rhamnulokinase n=1 Tax=Robertmurraya sp. FSL R5-0851 TaxID=2921584 RepID=UPI0030F9731F